MNKLPLYYNFRVSIPVIFLQFVGVDGWIVIVFCIIPLRKSGNLTNDPPKIYRVFKRVLYLVKNIHIKVFELDHWHQFEKEQNNI